MDWGYKIRRMPNCHLFSSFRSCAGFAVAILAALIPGSGTLHAAGPPSILSSTLPPGTAGTPYFATLAATGGTLPYTWTLGGTLPAGLSLSPAGAISGTPSTPAIAPYSFGVTLQDAAGNTAFATLSMKIVPRTLLITTASPLTAGIAGVDYPHKILAATGGFSPYTFAITSGSLPPGMKLNNGVILGEPAFPGSYQIIVSVTDSAGATASATLALTIKPSATDLLISEGNIAFSLSQGAGAPPSAQQLQVQSSLVSQQLSYIVSVPASASWLSVTGGLTTPATLSFSITPAGPALSAGTYNTTVNVLCVTTGCSGVALAVPVTLTVISAPAVLRVLNQLLAFTTDPSAPGAALTQQLQIRNSGGLPLAITSVNCHATWCAQGLVPSSVNGGVIAPVNITVSPASLSFGIHRTTVEVDTSAGNTSIPLTLLVLQKPSMGLPASGAQFTAPAGGTPAKPGGSFTITATGGTFSWTAAASATPAWLVISTASGTASPGKPGTVQYSISPGIVAGLAAGTYYGAIKLTAAGTTNSPQEFRVILTVTQPADPVRPQLAPAGLVLTAATASVTGAVSVLAPSIAPVAWQAAAQTTSGGAWLTVTPGTGKASAATPGASTVTANPAGLAPGIYKGTVSYAFAATSIRSVNVTLIVTTASAAAASSRGGTDKTARAWPEGPDLRAGCSPSAVAIAQTGLVNNFSASAAWPVPLAVNLIDDCGNPIANGAVVATFTDGDPPLALSLTDAASGLYASTWTPGRSASQVTINTTATVTGFATATAALVGEVAPNAQPSLNAYAVLNAFNPQVGDALAPGTVIAMYGAYLASAPTSPPDIPLLTNVKGTQVVIGGIAAPIYYAAPGQINAQIPFELDPALQHQVVISANGALTTPQTLLMEPANPGVAANADSTILAEHIMDGSLVSPASPAKPNEYIEAFAAGMGATTVNVATGAGAPFNPLAWTSPLPTATWDGAPLPLQFAGLVAGEVGLYQMNIQIPATAGNGNHTLVILQSNGVVSSNSTLIPVHN
jgi:uncharacterized protein (TIGR03437 family)